MTVPGQLLAVMVVLAIQGASAAPQFKSSIDLVQADVNVVDGNGRPLRDLKADDFNLRVDGKARRISSAQFIAVESGAAIPAALPAADYTTNARAAGGRLVMIVVDRGSITAGRGKAIMESAGRFVGQLHPADRAALASIPRGPQVDFTADHSLVQRLLRQIDGEAIAPVGLRNVSISDALAFERKDDVTVERILQRECGVAATPGQRGAGNSEVVVCAQQVRLEASQIAVDARHRARESIAGLRALLERLPPSSTPKVLVFISEGLVTANESSQLSWLEAKAAAQHVTLYALHLQPSEYDAGRRAPLATYSADRAALEEGLYQMTQVTRGDVFRVISNSDFAFQRLSVEMSGYYLLSFEPEAGERDGRAHDIEVTVRRKGATVRARRQFSIAPAVIKTAESEITALLRDPLPASEIPIAVTSYSFREPQSERVRLLIAAEIDQSINTEGRLSAGYVLVDFDRKLAARRLDDVVPVTGRRRGSIQPYFSTAVVDRGRYTLKLAVVDDGGRRGTVERVVRAQLNVAGPIRATDLLIADGATTSANLPLAPTIVGDFAGDMVHGYLELFADATETLDATTVTLEIGANESSAALAHASLPLRMTEDDVRCRIGGAALNIAHIPDGQYVARAAIAVRGRVVGRVTRPLRIVRSSPGAK